MPTKTLSYIHTPPRAFCDQWESNLAKSLAKVPESLGFLRPILQSILEWFRVLVLKQFKQSLAVTDYKIANSQNIQNRVGKYFQITTDQVLWPAVDTAKFQFLGQHDYYHSHCRLESLKRIELIVAAFEHLPHKKLVITSSGPLQDWLQNEIKTKNLTNIDFRGRVSDTELVEIMGNCIAGIMIPVDEDAGITQIEFLAAGKPVIAVAEGGLLETISGPILEKQELKNQVNSKLSQSETEMPKEKTSNVVQNSSSDSQQEKNFGENNSKVNSKNWQQGVSKSDFDLEKSSPGKSFDADNLTNLQTGILIPANPTLQDLIQGIEQMTSELALSLKENCQKVAQSYDQQVFFEKLDKAISQLLNS